MANLPTAQRSGQVPVSIGSGSIYEAQDLPGGSMSFNSGHSWDQTAASAAGAGSEFLNIDNGVLSISSGNDATGWYVEFGGPNLRDTCALASSAGYVRTTADLTGFTLGAMTLAVLFRWDGETGATYYSPADLGSRPRGGVFGIESSGADWKLYAYQGVFTYLTTFTKASFLTGFHALTVAAVSHDFGPGIGLRDAWAWSLDGSAVAYAQMATAYITPNNGDTLVMGASDNLDSFWSGSCCEIAAWTSTLTDAQMAALSTIPATPTCKLPITAAMGVPNAWVQALRYDPRMPSVCLVKIGNINATGSAVGVVRQEF